MKNTKAFTFVELIVVITILAILVSISFVSLKGYLANARDAKRYNDITELYKKIQNEMVLNQKLNITDFMTGNIQTLSGNITMYGKKYSGILIGDINFENLKENKENFQENIEGLEDYKIAIIPKTSYYGIIASRETEDTIPQTSIFTTQGEIEKMIVGDFNNDDLLAYDWLDTQNPDNCSEGECEEIDIPKDPFEGEAGVEQLDKEYSGGINCSGNCTSGVGYMANQTWKEIVIRNGNGTGYIIMDRNLGATSNDINNPNSYGYYYQWGNNYGFPNTGNILTGATLVDTTGYGPQNYYYSGTFIVGAGNGYDGLTQSFDWSKLTNYDLWGGTPFYLSREGRSTPTPLLIGPGTNEAKQGACPSGRHIPFQEELKGVYTLISGYIIDFQTDLKIPKSGLRNMSSAIIFRNQFEDVWTSTWTNGYDAITFGRSGYDVFAFATALPVRCFKN